MEAHCQCSTVSFLTPLPAPLTVFICHCTECRLQSASAFGTSAIFPATPFFPLPASLASKVSVWTRPTESGGTMDCYFCKVCGVRVFHRIRDADGKERDSFSVKGGCVQGLDWSKAKHIYCRSAVVEIPGGEGVERWDTVPEWMGVDGAEERKEK